MVQTSGENSKPFWSMRSGRERENYTPPSPPLYKDEGLKNIGHSTSIRNLIFGVNVLRFQIWFVMTVHYKTRQMLLQYATAILLQNATEIYYKVCQVFYYKMRQFYFKMRQLLQNVTFITNCDSTTWKYRVTANLARYFVLAKLICCIKKAVHRTQIAKLILICKIIARNEVRICL